MKTHFLCILLLSGALVISYGPCAYGDALQKDTPGAQGTEGTNPAHQDST